MPQGSREEDRRRTHSYDSEASAPNMRPLVRPPPLVETKFDYDPSTEGDDAVTPLVSCTMAGRRRGFDMDDMRRSRDEKHDDDDGPLDYVTCGSGLRYDRSERCTYDDVQSIDDAQSIRMSASSFGSFDRGTMDSMSSPIKGQRGTFDEPGLASAYDGYRKAFDTSQRPKQPSTYTEETQGLTRGLTVNTNRPAGEATKLDVFLRLRGLDKYADQLYEMGARTVNDLAYLEDADFESIGLNKADVRVMVQ